MGEQPEGPNTLLNAYEGLTVVETTQGISGAYTALLFREGGARVKSAGRSAGAIRGVENGPKSESNIPCRLPDCARTGAASSVAATAANTRTRTAMICLLPMPAAQVPAAC